MKQTIQTTLEAIYTKTSVLDSSIEEGIVLAKIQQLRHKQGVQRQIIFGCISTVSFGMFIIFLFVLAQEAATSGLWEYVYTVTSDMQYIGIYGLDALLLIGESLPVPLLIAELLVLFLGLVTGRAFLQGKQLFFHRSAHS